MKIRNSLIAAGLLASVSACAMSPAMAGEVGMLRCNVAPAIGMIVASDRKLDCQFKPTDNSAPTFYLGHIDRVGVDFGIYDGGVLVWAVAAPTGHVKSLSGKYIGASGGLSLGVGLGGNVLVGGSDNTVSLQPVSGEGIAGASIALGVGALTLN